jgi:hypothetical protein
MDLRSCGCESFYDWMQRGPFYHFSFDRAENNKATEVQINTTYTQNVDSKRLFVIAHYRKTVHITTSQGMVVNVAAREV